MVMVAFAIKTYPGRSLQIKFYIKASNGRKVQYRIISFKFIYIFSSLLIPKDKA
jgi:hypothetical protein